MGTFWEDYGVKEASEEKRQCVEEELRIANKMLKHFESPSEKKERLRLKQEAKGQKLGLLMAAAGVLVGLMGILAAIALSKGWL